MNDIKKVHKGTFSIKMIEIKFTIGYSLDVLNNRNYKGYHYLIVFLHNQSI